MILLLVSVWIRPFLGAAMAADRDGMRQAREIEIELVLESFTERLRRELIEELAECGSIRQLVNRKASRSRRCGGNRD